MIPYGRQDISEEDIAAVVSVLRSDYLTTGPAVPAFEAAVAARVGARHGVATNSATSALHVACAALGLGPGDWLWTVPNTFVASANVGALCGAGVDFVDIDPESFCMCPKALAAKLETTPEQSRPRIVMPVHMTGRSAEMVEIRSLAERYGFKLIEDASHGIGAVHAGHPVGSCALSDVTVFSFHPVKVITTAEGGMATTGDPILAERMARLRSHGITRDAGAMTEPSHGPWYYQQVDLGWNYRMTDVQAALGMSQLNRLEAFVARRNALADRYDSLLAGLPLRLPQRDPDGVSSFHLYVVRVAAERRRAVFEGMRAAGIGVQVHYIPVHLQPFWRAKGFAEGDFPQAERYYAEAISLPLYPTLTEAEQDRVASALRAQLGSAGPR